MKRLTLIVFLLAATTVAAQEPQIMIQHLEINPEKALGISVTGEYTTVYIIQDTTDYVAIINPYWSDTSQISQPIFKYQADQVRMWDNLIVAGYGAFTLIEIHLRTEKLFIHNRLYNRVVLRSSKGYGHKLKYKYLHLQTDDYSMVDIESPIEAEDIRMIAEKNSIIYYDTYTADNYSENTKDNAIIYGGIRNGESQANKHNLLTYKTDGYKPFEPKRMRYRPAQRIHLRLSTALLNGGRTATSGLGWKEETYPESHIAYPSMKTTLGSHQVELGYDVICRKHFAIGIGVGYSYSHYRFKDPYVGYIVSDWNEYTHQADNIYLTPRNPPYGGGDSLNNWSTHITTNYITFPISLTYYADRKHHKGFHVSVAVVPGFGLGQGKLNSRYCQWDENPETNSATGMIINDKHLNYGEIGLFSTVDYRITVGWSRWSVMLQLPDPSGFSFSLAATSMVSFFPFRLGLMLDL